MVENGANRARNSNAVAIELIRTAIVEGRMAPGERLKEATLARDLGLSRTPVREALLTLQAEGFLELEPNRGARVRSYTIAQLEDLYDVRALLEGHAARRAAERITELDLLRLKASCTRFDQLVAGQDLLELYNENANFHRIVVEVSGSDTIESMVRRATLPVAYSSYCWYSGEQKNLADQFHRGIMRAIEVRDGDRAEGLIREHLFIARDFLIERLSTGADALSRREPVQPSLGISVAADVSGT
jgi:DNA-binding GntR family transcriptional regulator